MGIKKINWLFVILLVYVILQSLWWMYNIWNLSAQVFTPEQMQGKLWMIFGEGAVFLIILSLGFVLTYKAFQREVKLSTQQKNFLMAVSHELKTPIASIKLYLQTLLKHDLDKEKQNEILLKSIKDTERLNELVENVLLTTQINDNSYPINFEQFNLTELVKKTSIALMESNTKKVDVEFFITDNIEFKGDKSALISIVSNLLGNALKYTETDSVVGIYLLRENQQITLSFSDQGTGIPNSEKENIFKQFYRIGNENTRKVRGTGLGLFIVKHLVEQHNGKVSVKDNSPKGVIFACTFNQQL